MGFSNGSASLSGDSDVALNGPAAGDVLAYDATTGKWKNSATSATTPASIGAEPAGLSTTTNTALAKTFGTVISVLKYGAVNDGVTDSRASIVAALADVVEGGTLYFPQGSYYWDPTNPVVVTTPRITLTGPGIIKGSFKIGNGSSRLEFRGRIALKFYRAPDTATYPTTGYASGSFFVQYDRIRGLHIKDSEFTGAAWPIYGLVTSSTASHDNSMLQVDHCRFDECDYAWYAPIYSSTTWQANADSDFTNNVVNRSYKGMVWVGGLDGGHIDGNTHFMITYSSNTNARFAEKMQNIFVGYSDWLEIHNNQLFECGLESIRCENTRVVNVSHNNIAWPGQRAPSDAIYLSSAPTGEYSRAAVTGNSIVYYTKSSVYVSGQFSSVALAGNSVSYSSTTATYVGSTALNTLNHFRYDVGDVTTLYPSQISISGNSTGNTGETDHLPGRTYTQRAELTAPFGAMSAAFRGISVTATTNILALTDTLGQGSQYGGLLIITAKGASSTSTAKTTVYTLLVSKTAASNSVTVIASAGYTTGAAADEPSFTWTVSSSSNVLQVTPVASASGTFYFSVQSFGDIVVG